MEEDIINVDPQEEGWKTILPHKDPSDTNSRIIAEAT
jgi:hypothetical protein